MGNLTYQTQGSSALKAQDAATYKARRPEEGPVFALIQNNWLKFVAQAEQTEKSVADYVTKEMEEFLGCGVLARGFLRLRCEGCAFTRLLPFSCKRRGFCPSCTGRRMNENAAYMVDYVFPHVPVRQFVLSFPIPVRYWMARNPKLISQLLTIFHRAINAHYRMAVKKLGHGENILTGAVTVVQRFGSALNLNVHFHTLVLDGAYVTNPDGVISFIETPRPTNDEIAQLLGTISRRMLRALQRKGLVQKLEAETGGDAIEREATIEDLVQGASVQYRLALGDPPCRPVRRIGSLGFIGEDPKPTGECSAIIGGYSMHANSYIHKNDRAGLERMCRYLLRPPIAEERLEFKRSPSGHDSVVYKLKNRWADGTKAILLTGPEFVEKIASIIPQPRIHGTRFHGVLAPHSAHRKLVVPKLEPKLMPKIMPKIMDDSLKLSPAGSAKKPNPRIGWAQLLARVFGLDVTECGNCGGKIKVIAAIIDEDVVKRILDHMGLPSHVPKFALP